MNYYNRPKWDTDLLLICTLGLVSNSALTGLVYEAVKATSGVPNTFAGHWIPGAKVINAGSGVNYINTGTTASPVWATVTHS